MRAHLGGRVVAEPNVTPMVDVMLVLLIIFMVLTPMLLAQLHATPPEARFSRSHPEESTDHTLGIDRYGAYYFDRRPVARDSLPALMRATFEQSDERVLFVRADRDLVYAKVLDALDIAARNGVRVVGMIAVQPPPHPR